MREKKYKILQRRKVEKLDIVVKIFSKKRTIHT